MHALSPPNIESELSYAYLHAVASKAGVACAIANRHEDNNGVDAHLTSWGPFNPGGYLTEVDLKIQLKATTGVPAESPDHYSYFLAGIHRYNDLRSQTLSTHRILIVLFLPADATDWLEHSHEQLVLRRSAYWVSLRGAAASDNDTGATVYLPKVQTFDPNGLTQLMSRLSRREIPAYQLP